MITVRLENHKVNKPIKHLYPFPKLFIENGSRVIYTCTLETLIELMDEADQQTLSDAMDYILRNEQLTLASRQVIIDKILNIVNFYKGDNGTFN